MDDPVKIAEFLRDLGGWGVAAIGGIAFWKILQRKDAELLALSDSVLKAFIENTAAVTKFQSYLTAINDKRDPPP